MRMMVRVRRGEAGYFWYLIARIPQRLRRKFLRSRRFHSILKRLNIVQSRHGVLFIGYVEAGLGLGESLRGLLRSLDKTTLPFAVYPYNIHVEDRFIGSFMPERYDRFKSFDINVIEMSVDQVPRMFKELGEWRNQDSYNVLRTYWELPRAPEIWKPILTRVDEIWVPNAFVARGFDRIFSGTVTIVPPCVDVTITKRFDRAWFEMEPDRFYFMFSFDYFSFPARKNPLGVVRAFRAAFPHPGVDKVGLVIKSTGSAAGHYPEIEAEIASAAAQDPRIKIIDRSISRNEVLSLIASSDCYVSLHRSEGFGLGMAEAMAFGVPVVGTDYSGSTEFLSEATGYPVPYKMRRLTAGEYLWSEGQSWAEPDEAAAAALLRRVHGDKHDREGRAANARALVERCYSHGAVASVAQRRIEQIMALRSADATGDHRPG